MSDSPERQVRFRTERVIVPFEEGDNPELEPLFANHFELARVNSDVYLDIGMIPPIEMTQLVEQYKPEGDPPTIRFYVLQRVAMTPETLERLRDKINELCGQQATKGATGNAGAEASPKKAD